MKNVAWLVILLTSAGSVASGPAATRDEMAEVAPLLAAMGKAANDHDVERHVGFYAHDPAVMLVFDGEVLTGWEAIRDKQREWWHNGSTDVVFQMRDKSAFVAPAAGVVVTTLLITSRYTAAGGAIKEGQFVVSDVWQKRREGWRVIYAHESTTH